MYVRVIKIQKMRIVDKQKRYSKALLSAGFS